MTNEEKELNEGTEDAKVYEIGYLLVPSLAVEKVPEEISILKEKITQMGGIFISDQDPNLITLSYSMDKVVNHKKSVFDSAYFGWIKFYLQANEVENLQKEIKSIESILRFIFIKTEKDDNLTAKKTLTNKEKEDSAKDTKALKDKPKVKMDKAEIDESIEELIID